ncbi:MAG: hypothetical protein AAF850_03155 [Pseudomonadota bacterium]
MPFLRELARGARRFGALMVAMGAVVSCASTTGDDGLPLAEAPSFQAGYGDGCSTAISDDKSFSQDRSRDDYLFENDRPYRAGWRQGYASCADRGLDAPTDGGRILGQQNEY